MDSENLKKLIATLVIAMIVVAGTKIFGHILNEDTEKAKQELAELRAENNVNDITPEATLMYDETEGSPSDMPEEETEETSRTIINIKVGNIDEIKDFNINALIDKATAQPTD